MAGIGQLTYDRIHKRILDNNNGDADFYKNYPKEELVAKLYSDWDKACDELIKESLDEGLTETAKVIESLKTKKKI